MGVTLIRIDKNGTKYYTDTVCPKCGGRGRIDHYHHIQDGECFLCGGSGYFVTNWKEYTPEYEAKLAERRLAKAKKNAPAKNAKFLKQAGFSEDGKAWIVLGNTYEIKEDLKAAGCKWHNLLGWHFDHKDNGYECFELSVDEVTDLSYAGEYIWGDYSWISEYIKEIKNKNAPKTESHWIGSVGDKVELGVKFKRSFSFETHFTYYGETCFIYKFADEEGNTVMWKTGKHLDLEEDHDYKISGTIKAHDEYKGDKQTVLTRCKIS